MDYANLQSQQPQLQEQANMTGQSISSLQTILPSSSGTYPWNPSIRILNQGTDLYSSETIPNSRLLFPCQATNNFMLSQGYLSNHGYENNQGRSLMNSCESPTKEETSDSFSKLRINLPFQGNKSYNLEPLHSSNSNIAHQDYSANFGADFASSGHVFPNNGFSSTTNLARLGSASLSSFFPVSHQELGLNKLQALDLLSSPRTSYGNSSSTNSQTTQNSSNASLYRECNMSLGYEMQDSISSSPSSLSNSNMKSGFFNEVTATRTKRQSPSNLSDSKDQSQSNIESKKSKSTSRSSNPPLKVRKEKLGDRISALHRLVAPFGKTDTASVLTEAIGYIQFLHDQVQTLSTPYMNSFQSKPSRKTYQVHGFGKDAETERKILDLRSRGLCLVPVSCASYLNGFDL